MDVFGWSVPPSCCWALLQEPERYEQLWLLISFRDTRMRLRLFSLTHYRPPCWVRAFLIRGCLSSWRKWNFMAAAAAPESSDMDLAGTGWNLLCTGSFLCRIIVVMFQCIDLFLCCNSSHRHSTGESCLQVSSSRSSFRAVKQFNN